MVEQRDKGASVQSSGEEPRLVEDGFGGVWLACSATCDMVVVRPGKVQCSCARSSADRRQGGVS